MYVRLAGNCAVPCSIILISLVERLLEQCEVGVQSCAAFILSFGMKPLLVCMIVLVTSSHSRSHGLVRSAAIQYLSIVHAHASGSKAKIRKSEYPDMNPLGEPHHLLPLELECIDKP